jgi:hypothetical protein
VTLGVLEGILPARLTHVVVVVVLLPFFALLATAAMHLCWASRPGRLLLLLLPQR